MNPTPYRVIVRRPGTGRPGGIFSTPTTIQLINPHKDRTLPGKRRRLARKAWQRAAR